MEDTGLAACSEALSSKLPSPSFSHPASESFYSPPSTWISNAQLPAGPVIQSQNINADSYFSAGSSAEIMGTHMLSSTAESSMQGIPFVGNDVLKPELVPNAVAAYSAQRQNSSNNMATSNSLAHEAMLQVSSSTTSDASSLSESLHRIQQFSINTSLSLEACCPCEWKLSKNTLPANHNMATLSCIGMPSDNSSAGINDRQSIFVPRHATQGHAESSIQLSSGKVDRGKNVSKASHAEHTDVTPTTIRDLQQMAHVCSSQARTGAVGNSACDCNVSISSNAPGTELSLAIASVMDSGSEQETGESNASLGTVDGNLQRMSESIVERTVSRKDEMFLKLVQQVRELELQLQERKEWAHQKAMQAACKFSKDMSELQSLRLEHEEILRLKRDTQALEESTMKRLTDMESALRKASAQVDRANATVRKLETENAELRAEMEAAKLSAAESNALCQEVAKREKKSAKKIQAWEKQKAKLAAEIAKQKHQIAETQQRLSEVTSQQHEAEMRWRQEEKVKDEAVLLADAEKWAREQLEIAAKRREESWRQKAEADYQRHKDDLKRLECELEHLKLAADARACNTTLSSVGAVVAKDTGCLQHLKDTNTRLLRELAELQGDVRRDRECVMCMSEESSVVFLPCAHQIVCVDCNDIHEKQGMRDCPSCRTVIQSRVHVIDSRTT